MVSSGKCRGHSPVAPLAFGSAMALEIRVINYEKKESEDHRRSWLSTHFPKIGGPVFIREDDHQDEYIDIQSHPGRDLYGIA